MIDVMKVNYKIREFDPKDIDVVMTINRSTLPENYPEQFFLGLYYHAPKAFLVAILDEVIVGYIMCRVERGISSFGKLPVKKGHIVSVAVATEYRHRGIGSGLIKAGMEGMHSYGAVEFFLEVRKANEEAVSVYESLGYELKRILKGYYRDGADAYLMVKKHPKPLEESPVEEV